MRKSFNNAPLPAAFRGTGQTPKTSSATITKLPAHGKALADRQRFKNLPFLVVVCVGGDAWQDAKQWQQRPDISALVLTPDQDPNALDWPVTGCACVIEWSSGPDAALIVELVKALLRAGAVSVTVRPLFADQSAPAAIYDTGKPIGQRWTPARESLKTYYQPRKELKHVA